MIEQLHTRPSEYTQSDTGKSLLPSLRQIGVMLIENIKRGIIRQPSKPIFPEGLYFDGSDGRLKRVTGDRVSSDEYFQVCKGIKFYNMLDEIDEALSDGTKLQLKNRERVK